MAWRRVLYLLALGGTFLLYVFHTRYFSWLLFTVAVALPFISLVCALPFAFGQRITLECAEPYMPAGSEVTLRLRCKNVPVTRVKLTLTFENIFTGEKNRRRAKLKAGEAAPENVIHYKSKGCGAVRCGIKRARVLDMLGLFALPVKVSAPVQLLFVPPPTLFTGTLEDLAAPEEEATQPAAPGQIGEREYTDMREFRQGDAMRDIHWKLSARQNKLMVREYQHLVGRSVEVGLLWAGSAAALESATGRLLGLLAFLADNAVPVKLFWASVNAGGEPQTHAATPQDEAAHRELLWALFSTRAAAAQPGGAGLLLQSMPGEGMAQLLVDDSCIRLYHHGVPKGEFA